MSSNDVTVPQAFVEPLSGLLHRPKRIYGVFNVTRDSLQRYGLILIKFNYSILQTNRQMVRLSQINC
jgi:hypothetical protein